MPLIHDARFQRVHEALHKLWTRAVGSPDYVKDDWTELDNAILELAKYPPREPGPFEEWAASVMREHQAGRSDLAEARMATIRARDVEWVVGLRAHVPGLVVEDDAGPQALGRAVADRIDALELLLHAAREDLTAQAAERTRERDHLPVLEARIDVLYARLMAVRQVLLNEHIDERMATIEQKTVLQHGAAYELGRLDLALLVRAAVDGDKAC